MFQYLPLPGTVFPFKSVVEPGIMPEYDKRCGDDSPITTGADHPWYAGKR